MAQGRTVTLFSRSGGELGRVGHARLLGPAIRLVRYFRERSERINAGSSTDGSQSPDIPAEPTDYSPCLDLFAVQFFNAEAYGVGAMMDLQLLPMTPCDLADVLRLWAATGGVGLNESDTPDQLRAFLDRNPGLSLVARDGLRLIGAVLCGHDGRRGYLHHLAILPQYRGRGLGRQLVEMCLIALGTLGILKCNIFLYADNATGERFWSHCGWKARADLKVLQRTTDCPSTNNG